MQNKEIILYKEDTQISFAKYNVDDEIVKDAFRNLITGIAKLCNHKLVATDWNQYNFIFKYDPSKYDPDTYKNN